MRLPTIPVRLIILAVIILGLGATTLVSVPLLMVMGTTAAQSETTTGFAASDANCGPVATVSGRNVQVTEAMLSNARTIIETGRDLGVPDRGLVVAIATAMQESTLRNIDYGDRDSIGLFQQRDAWGSRSERLDPATSALMFYTGGRAGQRGLLDIRNWSGMSITRAAQAVQVSAFPLAYAKWERLAATLVESVIGNDPLECSTPVTYAVSSSTPDSIARMLEVAAAQVGDPYQWGATGPESFDCSGLVVYSWRQAGYQLNIRTADQMWRSSTPVPAGSEKPGDLLFGAFGGGANGGVGHVMIVIQPGLAVNAPETGRNVELTDYTSFGPSWRFARLKPSAMTQIGAAA